MLEIWIPPKSTPTDTHVPYTKLFRAGQRRFVRGGAGFSVAAPGARAAYRSLARTHARQPAGGIPVRVAAAGPGRGAGDALVARNVRLQLRDLHLDHVGHGVRWRRQPVRPADLGDGGGHHERSTAVGPAPGARDGADGGLEIRKSPRLASSHECASRMPPYA